MEFAIRMRYRAEQVRKLVEMEELETGEKGEDRAKPLRWQGFKQRKNPNCPPIPIFLEIGRKVRMGYKLGKVSFFLPFLFFF